MRALLAATIFLIGCTSTAFAQDVSLDYSISDAGRYCELRVGEKVPARVVLRRKFREYVEGGRDYNVIRVYGACGGRVPVQVLLDGANGSISDIIIRKRGICVSGSVCVGDTLAVARKALPSAKTIVAFEEGQVLYMRLSDYLTLGFNVEDRELSCPSIPNDGCLRSVLSRKVADITISNRIKP